MLTFLAIACKKRFTVDGYQDQAVGILEKDRAPKPWGSKQAARFNTPPTLPDASKQVPASRWYGKYSVNPWLRVVTRLSLFGCDEPSSTEPRWIVATTG